MKLINKNNTNPTFKVHYFGIQFELPMKYLHGYIVTNKDGSVVAYKHTPVLLGTGYGHMWISENNDEPLILGTVDLEDFAWQDTLMNIDSHDVEKSL